MVNKYIAKMSSELLVWSHEGSCLHLASQSCWLLDGQEECDADETNADDANPVIELASDDSGDEDRINDQGPFKSISSPGHDHHNKRKGV